MKGLSWFKKRSVDSRSNLKGHVSWSKYLLSSRREMEGGEEEMGADMSELYIGSKFAFGRHSRIYRGVYKEMDVAIKLIKQPEEDDPLAYLLEKQSVSEVSLLFRLKHPNIIRNARPPLPTACPMAFSYLITRCWSTNPDKRPDFDEIVSILEWYRDAFEDDPAFFFSYRPSQYQPFLGCIPRCMSVHNPASIKA
ncbi:hypothetical protein GIB67_003322 [Kingdonia uniflora]|uniref:Serine-threonine/tyrosine-protein kinase catalytic domain-containing protein n=1 Tax=Kingdonia uniflora TaxID=39325 RepID=A0A7J7P9L4_9MAGN|nr:hypothetical protein GIB67_003322 [Kingdonia uniflora]